MATSNSARRCILSNISRIQWFLSKNHVGLNKQLAGVSVSYTTEAGTEERDLETTGEVSDIERKRDVSRLPKHIRDRMMHVHQPPKSKLEFMEYRSYKRRLYAKYGKKSGVDPGIMWPTLEEMEEKVADEAEWDPTLQQMWAKLQAEEMEDKKAKAKKDAEIEAAMKKMPEHMEKFKARQAKVTAAEEAGASKTKALMEEARDYFGYSVHPKDPRFVQMQEQKAEQEKLQAKQKKKEVKQAKLLSNIQHLADKSQTKTDKPDDKETTKAS